MTNKLYDENFYPTKLMSEFLTDINNTGIFDVLRKYQETLPPHEVVGFITSKLHRQSAMNTLKRRSRIRCNTKT